jgi:hypothetical protein
MCRILPAPTCNGGERPPPNGVRDMADNRQHRLYQHAWQMPDALDLQVTVTGLERRMGLRPPLATLQHKRARQSAGLDYVDCGAGDGTIQFGILTEDELKDLCKAAYGLVCACVAITPLKQLYEASISRLNYHG